MLPRLISVLKVRNSLRLKNSRDEKNGKIESVILNK